jgi:hypothetical protein
MAGYRPGLDHLIEMTARPKRRTRRHYAAPVVLCTASYGEWAGPSRRFMLVPARRRVPMRYQIEISTIRRGAARVHLPGRILELEARRVSDTGWDVSVADARGGKSGAVSLSAASANDAVWRVARAAARAWAELTGTPLEEEPQPPPP